MTKKFLLLIFPFFLYGTLSAQKTKEEICQELLDFQNTRIEKLAQPSIDNAFIKEIWLDALKISVGAYDHKLEDDIDWTTDRFEEIINLWGGLKNDFTTKKQIDEASKKGTYSKGKVFFEKERSVIAHILEFLQDDFSEGGQPTEELKLAIKQLSRANKREKTIYSVYYGLTLESLKALQKHFKIEDISIPSESQTSISKVNPCESKDELIESYLTFFQKETIKSYRDYPEYYTNEYNEDLKIAQNNLFDCLDCQEAINSSNKIALSCVIYSYTQAKKYCVENTESPKGINHKKAALEIFDAHPRLMNNFSSVLSDDALYSNEELKSLYDNLENLCEINIPEIRKNLPLEKIPNKYSSTSCNPVVMSYYGENNEGLKIEIKVNDECSLIDGGVRFFPLGEILSPASNTFYDDIYNMIGELLQTENSNVEDLTFKLFGMADRTELKDIEYVSKNFLDLAEGNLSYEYNGYLGEIGFYQGQNINENEKLAAARVFQLYTRLSSFYENAKVTSYVEISNQENDGYSRGVRLEVYLPKYFL